MQQISRAVIKLSGRDFIVSKDTILSTFSLKKSIGEKITIPVVCCFDEANHLVSKTYVATAVVENNYKDKKVQSFKMKNRTRTRRSRGSRSHCTTIKITDILLGGK
jgi:ribosomal protein L21